MLTNFQINIYELSVDCPQRVFVWLGLVRHASLMVWSVASDASGSGCGSGDAANQAEDDPWALPTSPSHSDRCTSIRHDRHNGPGVSSASPVAVAAGAATELVSESSRGQKRPAESGHISPHVSESLELEPKRVRYDTYPLPSQRRLHMPAFTKGTEWWALPLWNSLAEHIAKMPDSPPARAMRVESFCAGTCSEAFGSKAFIFHTIRSTTHWFLMAMFGADPFESNRQCQIQIVSCR